jgi:DNA polymerase-1
MKENLAAHRDDAFLSRQLIDLKEDLDIPLDENDYRLPDPDTDKLKELYTELEFTRLMKAEIPVQEFSREGFFMVQSDEEIAGLVKLLHKADFMVLDTETSDLDPYSAELVGLSICLTFISPWAIKMKQAYLHLVSFPKVKYSSPCSHSWKMKSYPSWDIISSLTILLSGGRGRESACRDLSGIQ